jgi:hypothetical protein
MSLISGRTIRECSDFLTETKTNFTGKPPLKDAAQSAAEGRGEIQITIQHGYRAEARIDLNQLGIEPLF